MEAVKQETGLANQEAISDEFQRCVCLEILCKPVVLACGHISCFWFVFNVMNVWHELNCPVCRQPYNYFPSICHLLHFLLHKLYPLTYEKRDRQVGGSTQAQQWQFQSASFPKNVYHSWLSGNGPKVHVGVGCDYCWMSPITGERYKCKDCVESIGFDLCEACHNNSVKIPGRFNQQHKPEHKLEIATSEHKPGI